MAVPWEQALLLPIVVLIEGFIIQGMLGGKLLAAMLQSCVANVVSTGLGTALYLTTMPFVGEPLYDWWFKGGFAFIRSACIATAFAAILWAISWSSETLIITRMRNATSVRSVGLACAVANAATYFLLLLLALSFSR